MTSSEYSIITQLPSYLRDSIGSLIVKDICEVSDGKIPVLELQTISQIDSLASQYRHLLLRRYVLTEQISHVGLHPPLIYQRALVYEALGYDDLAAADAFVAYTLCETVRNEEWVSDLEPAELSGEPWTSDGDDLKNLILLCSALAVMCRALVGLEATKDASEKFDELVERYGELLAWSGSDEDLRSRTKDYVFADRLTFLMGPSRCLDIASGERQESPWGVSRREIYPWNDFEPDRNSSESLLEINSMLTQAAPDLATKVTVLPALNEDGSPSEGTWHQLGLFAAKNLNPGQDVLKEKSLLTAIRPLDDALCDACGIDLESISRDAMRQCPGENCDTTFCSEDCGSRAADEYHKPNLAKDATYGDIDEDEDQPSDYPPARAPFCSNAALHEIGRTSSTTTAEWDLYFLLLTRTIQMSTTQSNHPLSLPSTRYLWGDFNPTPQGPSITPPKKTLPWSLHHNLTLPLQYFETLMHSLPTAKPYSGHWLVNFDWWIQSTLFAKFRGVANAQQSTFDGKAEIAAVHPLWCLANHSCEPNVGWKPTGERVFWVREGDEVVGRRKSGEGWSGIREGEEIWSHYTDVRLPVRERREKLLEVLGGVCRCSRCLREAGEA